MTKSLLAICTFNRRTDLERLFTSLSFMNLFEVTILLIDATQPNNSDYWDWAFSEQEKLSKLLSAPKILWLQHKKGLTLQRNSALKFAHSGSFDFIHFIDDDVELHKDYFKYICEYFVLNQSCIGITGQRLGEYPQDLPVNQNIFSLIFSRILRKINGTTAFGTVSPSGLNNMSYGDTILKIDWLSGCSMSYRLSGIKSNYFSEEFSDYSLMEDLDFSYSLNKRGQLFYVPNAKLTHHVSQANRWQYLKGLRIEAHNRTSFVFKHRDTLSISRHVASYILTIVRLLLQGLTKRKRLSESFAVLRGLTSGLCMRRYR